MEKGKRAISVGALTMLATLMVGCSPGGEDMKDDQAAAAKQDFIPETMGTYEAEEASLTGNVKAASIKGGYSGTGYAVGFEEDDDLCTFHIGIEEEGFYDLNFVSASAGGEKTNFVSVDGTYMGTIFVENTDFSDSYLNRVFLEAGEHEITVSKSWGWILLDYLEVLTAAPLDESIYEVSAKLCNPNATEETQRLFSYLTDIYGEKFLSGQHCDTGEFGKEFQVIKRATGETPAVLGLDFIEYTPSRVENGSSSNATDLAIRFWEDGGIAAFCWHWNAPSKYLKDPWYSGFYTEYTNINLADIMDGKDTEGYDLLMADIDAIAQQLLTLQEAGVPILWRPLHEASGGWFWWGDSGADAYKQLYILLYDKLTNEYGLNNLIWLWNGQDAEWYPGDEYVDIIGVDIYPGEQVYTSQAADYLKAVSYSTEHKMVYLSENGCLFDPDLAKRDGAMWGMWCTWGGDFVAKDTSIFTISEQYTEESMMQKVYAHEDVLTLEDLPDFSTYPIKED